MAAIHGRELLVTDEDGERMVERLRVIAVTASVLLAQKEGGVEG